MDLDDFILKRRAEIAAQIAELQRELAKLDAAEQAVARVRVGWEQVRNPAPANVPAPHRTRRAGVREGSIKDWILRALAHRPGGLETGEVIVQVAILGGPNVQRPSMTPQLSRLKEAGRIIQVDRKWMLSEPDQLRLDIPGTPDLSNTFGSAEPFDDGAL
jgi:hypothetical protein